MKFLDVLQGIFSNKGLEEKAKNKQLTPDDWKVVGEAIKAESGLSLEDFHAKLLEEKSAESKDDQSSTEILSKIADVISGMIPSTSDGGDNEDEDNNGKIKSASPEKTLESVQKFAEAFDKMTNKASEKKPEAIDVPIIGLNGPGTTTSHFLGIAHSHFDRSKRWNEIASLGNHGSMNQTPSKEQTEDFNQSFSDYGVSLAQRYAELRAANKLDSKSLSNFDNDYSGLAPAKLGDQYLVRRQDALIARLVQFYNVYVIYPRRFNVQDRDVMFTAFFNQVSQAYQEGPVFKGGMQLQPEMAHVDDAMIKLNFKPMKEIERMYIGYLNTEGSDPMKWSMIEWQLLNILQVAINEQNHRRIMGIYVKPEKDTPGHYLHSSTGVLYTLMRYASEYKLKLHDDDAFCGYTNTTMLETVQEILEQIKLDVAKDHTVKFENFEVQLNVNHKLWWKQNCRAKYGKDQDFTGPDGMLSKVPDIDTIIKWVPNFGLLPIIIIQEHGNIQLPENVPGEMLGLQFDREMESYKAWSVWKEGCSASFVGKQFSTKAELDANNYHMQRIFMNAPLTILAADAATIDASIGFWFRSVANTVATAITDITNPEFGVAYRIEVGDETNPQTIAKAGKFSEIISAYNPTKKGDYIMIVLNSAGTKFFELERCVAGVRSINKELQPNIPGAR